MGGARYFATSIADFSRKMLLYKLKSKGNFFEKFKKFKALVESQSKYNIKIFWSNNYGEFVSKAFNHFLKDHGI